MNKYILYTSITLPALILSACTNPAEEALEKARLSKSPEDCLNALVVVLREGSKEKDQQRTIEQLFELQSIVRQFTPKDAFELVMLYNKEETRKQINELEALLLKEKMNIPSLIDIIRGK